MVSAKSISIPQRARPGTISLFHLLGILHGDEPSGSKTYFPIFFTFMHLQWVTSGSGIVMRGPSCTPQTEVSRLLLHFLSPTALKSLNDSS